MLRTVDRMVNGKQGCGAPLVKEIDHSHSIVAQGLGERS